MKARRLLTPFSRRANKGGLMPQPKLTTRERVARAVQLADSLAHDLEVLGYVPQAQIARDLSDGLYQAQLIRAQRDLAKP